MMHDGEVVGSVAPDFLTSNFESDRFSIKRFLNTISLGFERGCQALAPGPGLRRRGNLRPHSRGGCYQDAGAYVSRRVRLLCQRLADVGPPFAGGPSTSWESCAGLFEEFSARNQPPVSASIKSDFAPYRPRPRGDRGSKPGGYRDLRSPGPGNKPSPARRRDQADR
jgi:hypothetical protein